MDYLIDTNAFWEILKEWNGSIPQILLPMLKGNGNGKICFYLPEICAMEIYSVLGKYVRGKNGQELSCERVLQATPEEIKCSNTWVSPPSRKLSNREAAAFLLTIQRILNKLEPDFDINIVPLDANIIQKGTALLHRYANKFELHSLDSLVAASANTMTIITYDKALKNVLREAGIPFYIEH